MHILLIKKVPNKKKEAIKNIKKVKKKYIFNLLKKQKFVTFLSLIAQKVIKIQTSKNTNFKKGKTEITRKNKKYSK